MPLPSLQESAAPRRLRRSRLSIASLVLMGVAAGLIALAHYGVSSSNLARGLAILLSTLTAGSLCLIAFLLALLGCRAALLNRRSKLLAYTTMVLNVIVPFGYSIVAFWWPTPERLVRAAIDGDIDVIKRGIFLHVDLNAPAKVSLGFNPGGSWSYSETPLTQACICGQYDFVRILVSNGADVNQLDGGGESPIGAAVSGRHENVLRLLLDSSAQVNIQNKESGRTPLHYALSSFTGNRPTAVIVKMLLEHGADPDLPDKYGETPRMCASRLQDPQINQLIADRAPSQESSDDSPNRLLHAISLGNPEEFLRITKKHPEYLEEKSATGGKEYLLGLCARFGLREAVTYLLDQGAEINAISKAGISATALHNAVFGGHREVAGILIDRGADIHLNVGSYYGTPLHVAADQGHVEIAQMLLEKKANVNAGTHRDGSGPTPLHYAADRGHLAMVRLLVEQGAEVNMNLQGNWRTPLYQAAENGYVEVTRFLLQHGGVCRTSGSYGGNQAEETLKKAGLSDEAFLKMVNDHSPLPGDDKNK